MLRERESKDRFHGLWGVQVDPHTTPHPPSFHSLPQELAAPYMSKAIVRFETISDLKDDLKEILFPIF